MKFRISAILVVFLVSIVFILVDSQQSTEKTKYSNGKLINEINDDDLIAVDY